MAQKQQINPNTLLIIGGIAVLYFGLINPLLKKIGLKKSESDKNVDDFEKLPNADNPFSPVFLRKIKPGTKIKLITQANKEIYAKKIYNALGYFTDNEAEVLGVFKNLKTQTQVSDLATYFQIKYNQDLFTFLKKGKGIMPEAGLNSEELSQIISLVNSLPKYV